MNTHTAPSLPMLQVKNLRTAFCREGEKRASLVAVDGLSFSIKAGECLGIVGESGCGKSVTAMSILKLLPQPSGQILSGEVLFEGRDLLNMKPRELRKIRGGEIAMIFQDPMQALNPVQSIGEQIMEALALHQNLHGRAARAEAIELLRRVQIPSPEQRIDDYPHQLSGGIRQRVLIAQALAGKPKLIIADEPTTALDVTVQQQILQLLCEQQCCATLLITHDLGVVAQHCDRVLVMYAGRMLESAPVEQLFQNPQHAYTKALLQSMPRGQKKRKTLLYSIPGQVCSIENFVEGCRFCQRLGVECEQLLQRPEIKEIEPLHFVSKCPRCCPDEA